MLNGLFYKDAKKQLQRFQEFAECNNILPLTIATANKSAEIYASLRKSGKTIDHNDVLIAGIAIANNMVLISNNTSHFNRITELDLDNWTM